MSRRNISPLKNVLKSLANQGIDPRDNIIRKLKEDMIELKGRQKDLIILRTYLQEIDEKNRYLTAHKIKMQQECKLKTQLTLQTINDLRKQIDSLKIQLRNTSIDLRQIQQKQIQLKKLLNIKTIEIEKYKKQAYSLHEQNQKIMDQFSRFKLHQQQILHQIRKINQSKKDYQERIYQINKKIIQVKTYIQELNNQNVGIRNKLKAYQDQNTGMGDNLEQKQDKISELEHIFTDKHQEIKSLVQGYIEQQHRNQRSIKQTRHKTNLLKLEVEKSHQLQTSLKKIEKYIYAKQKQCEEIRQECNEINSVNEDYAEQNEKLSKDLICCQQHLQNVFKHNSYIQQKMQNYVRDDDTIIRIIQKKKILPSLDNFRSMRTSRNQYKNSQRNY